MYIIKVEVDIKEVIKFHLTDPYNWKRSIFRAFPNSDGKREFIFKVIKNKDGSSILIMYSDKKPIKCKWGIWEIREIFDLNIKKCKINVLMNVCTGGRYRSNRVDSKNYVDWFIKKKEKEGMTTNPNNVDYIKNEDIRIPSKDPKARFYAVNYTAIVDIMDKEKFMNAYKNGIGHGKCFGFGLMTIKPIL